MLLLRAAVHVRKAAGQSHPRHRECRPGGAKARGLKALQWCWMVLQGPGQGKGTVHPGCTAVPTRLSFAGPPLHDPGLTRVYSVHVLSLEEDSTGTLHHAKEDRTSVGGGESVSAGGHEGGALREERVPGRRRCLEVGAWWWRQGTTGGSPCLGGLGLGVRGEVRGKRSRARGRAGGAAFSCRGRATGAGSPTCSS